MKIVPYKRNLMGKICLKKGKSNLDNPLPSYKRTYKIIKQFSAKQPNKDKVRIASDYSTKKLDKDEVESTTT